MLESDTLHEEYEERAAIMEFDGQLTREEAERSAWALVMRDTHVRVFGALLPIPALALLLDLERRDCDLRADQAHDHLWVRPPIGHPPLTADEIRDIRRYKHLLIHVVAHVDLPASVAVPQPLPEAVQWRLDGMRATHGHVPVPCAVLQPARLGVGYCLSCGQRIHRSRYGRCTSCATAATLFQGDIGRYAA